VYSVNADDQIQSAGAISYTYDADGNRVTATSPVSSASYTYDDANYLTEMSTSAITATYTYNGDHARTATTVNGTTTLEVCHDGQRDDDTRGARSGHAIARGSTTGDWSNYDHLPLRTWYRADGAG